MDARNHYLHAVYDWTGEKINKTILKRGKLVPDVGVIDISELENDVRTAIQSLNGLTELAMSGFVPNDPPPEEQDRTTALAEALVSPTQDHNHTTEDPHPSSSEE